MTAKQVARWTKKLEAERTKVGKTRDGLRDTLDELEGLKESCDRAYDSLGEAIDALSEMA